MGTCPGQLTLSLFDLDSREDSPKESSLQSDPPERSDPPATASPVGHALSETCVVADSHSGPARACQEPDQQSDRGAGAGASPERVDENPLALLTGLVAQLATANGRPAPGSLSLWQARDDWLRRLQAAQRSKSALTAYRIAIDDLL